ncbi:hypothetical protein CN378_15305 [Bacillus sp. AFS015802]|nr:hypothetical protein CN378_15305 [Bacillus sp. AFS015802]
MDSPDKHKMNGLKKALFAFLDRLAYDLEGLAAGARQLRPRRAKHEEAQLTPRGKRALGAEINQHFPFKTTKFRKTAYKKEASGS